jgi:hypothetical protein
MIRVESAFDFDLDGASDSGAATAVRRTVLNKR